MGQISFQCHECQARFDVDASLAGKTGRCRSCGAKMTIPKSSTSPAIPARVPQMAGAAASGAASRPSQPARSSAVAAGRPMSWIDAVNSSAALAPISEAGLKPAVLSKRVADALREDDRPDKLTYSIESMPAAPSLGPQSKAAGPVARMYRGNIGGIQKFLRWINDFSYLISVPFLALILVGALTHNRSLAILGATIAVLLNLGRLATGLLNLVAIPFRESPVQGVMFLIPPLTFLYIAQHWKKLKKPLKRVAEPLVTMVLVFLAFTFIPSLQREGTSNASIQDRLKAEAKALKGEFADEVNRVTSEAEKAAAKMPTSGGSLDLQKLTSEAQKQIERFRGGAGAPGTPEGEQPDAPKP